MAPKDKNIVKRLLIWLREERFNDCNCNPCNMSRQATLTKYLWLAVCHAQRLCHKSMCRLDTFLFLLCIVIVFESRLAFKFVVVVFTHKHTYYGKVEIPGCKAVVRNLDTKEWSNLLHCLIYEIYLLLHFRPKMFRSWRLRTPDLTGRGVFSALLRTICCVL